MVWDKDASYQYYRHGPLQRMEVGQDKVQGVDYTYTIHGWLKAINGTETETGAGITANAFRMALTYYSGDYKRTGNGVLDGSLVLNPAAGRDLYNGNISAWSRYIAPRPGGPGGLVFDGRVTGEQFTYDELNRIKSTTFQSLSGAAAAAYQTSYSYDANGNLLNLTRNNHQARSIDNLTYRYNLNAAGGLVNNRLRGVGDASNQAQGVVNQTAQDNYSYDEIGNLTADAQDNIDITWTVYGKVRTVTKRDNSRRIAYLYDSQGNRTVKTVTERQTDGTDRVTSTYYVRDAQGNVLSVYEQVLTAAAPNAAATQSEIYLYGSSRLGVYKPRANRSVATNGIYSRSLRLKEYELTDHLGNVRAVVGDYRQSDGANPVRVALLRYYNHYAFGLDMPLMTWQGTGGGYRYGYNGKEMDRDFANNYDYGFRIYNPAVGKFLSVDPISSNFPFYSPYHYAGNSPIGNIDMDGLEDVTYLINYSETGEVKTRIIDYTQTKAKVGPLGHGTLTISHVELDGHPDYTHTVFQAAGKYGRTRSFERKEYDSWIINTLAKAERSLAANGISDGNSPVDNVTASVEVTAKSQLTYVKAKYEIRENGTDANGTRIKHKVDLELGASVKDRMKMSKKDFEFKVGAYINFKTGLKSNFAASLSGSYGLYDVDYNIDTGDFKVGLAVKWKNGKFSQPKAEIDIQPDYKAKIEGNSLFETFHKLVSEEPQPTQSSSDSSKSSSNNNLSN